MSHQQYNNFIYLVLLFNYLKPLVCFYKTKITADN